MTDMKKGFRTIITLFTMIFIVFGAVCSIRSEIKEQERIKERYGTREFYHYRNERLKQPSNESEVSLIAVGDLSYSRGVEGIIRQKNDMNYPLRAVSEYIENSDLAFANLETPLIEGAKIPLNSMLFRSDPDTALALRLAGFSVVSLANNHSMNFREKGLADTLTALRNAGIRAAGAGVSEKEAYAPVYLDREGIRFAFLAYVDPSLVKDSDKATATASGVALMDDDFMKAEVKQAKRSADFVIVSMHAGTEYSNSTSPVQIEFARAAIDAGADLIIGQHPHVVQPIEKYQGKYIFYSLGNFVFDQVQSKNTREGLMIKVYFSKKEITKILLLPVFSEKYAQPMIADGQERDSVLEKIKYFTTKQDVYSSSDGIHYRKKTRDVIVAKRDHKLSNWTKAIYESNRTNAIYESNQTKTIYDDLDGDSIMEKYRLENGRLSISTGSKTNWISPLSWWIDDFELADSNHDGKKDINLSLWKAGNYGKYMPIWVKENDMSIKNHFFILDYSNGRVRYVWCSSNLSQPNCEFKFADINRDSRNELIVIEGDYTLAGGNQGVYAAVWSWNGWGFSNEWRSKKGNYKNLIIEKANGETFFVMDREKQH